MTFSKCQKEGGGIKTASVQLTVDALVYAFYETPNSTSCSRHGSFPCVQMVWDAWGTQKGTGTYEKVGRTAGGLSPGQVMADALYRLAGALSRAMRDKPGGRQCAVVNRPL